MAKAGKGLVGLFSRYKLTDFDMLGEYKLASWQLLTAICYLSSDECPLWMPLRKLRLIINIAQTHQHVARHKKAILGTMDAHNMMSLQERVFWQPLHPGNDLPEQLHRGNFVFVLHSWLQSSSDGLNNLKSTPFTPLAGLCRGKETPQRLDRWLIPSFRGRAKQSPLQLIVKSLQLLG